MTSSDAERTLATRRCCHHCGADIGEVKRVGRRDACLRCGADLHCCLNCEWYDSAYHNQCREPQAERQVDKDRSNFCDFFRFKLERSEPAGGADEARARLEALFGGGGRK